MIEQKVKIFLDESGIVREQKLGVMGALLIPENTYESKTFKNIFEESKSSNIIFHWNEFSIFRADKYYSLFNSLTPFLKFMQANFLLYHYQNLKNIDDK